jgi:thiazole tautomerase (transcriptional regulator TenI)
MTGAPRARVPRLHVVTTREILERPDFVDAARQVLAAGELALHLRASGSSGQLLLDRALALAAGREPGTLLVNDRVDVARIAGTGAHLPEAGLTPLQARTILGRDPLLGRSVHDPEASEGDGAVGDAGAGLLDFVIYGHVFATPAKAGLAPRGLAGLRQAAKRYAAAGLPLIAIGGITREHLSAILEAGAHGAAAIAGIWDAADPAAEAARWLETLAAFAGRPTARGLERS